MNSALSKARRALPFGLLTIGSLLLMRGYQVTQSYPKGPSAEWMGPGLLIVLAIGAFLFYLPQTVKSGTGGRGMAQKAAKPEARPRAVVGLLSSWSAVVFLVAGLEWLLLVYRVDGYYTTPDTFEYARVGEANIASAAFWAGERPFTVPLAFKVFGLTTSVVKERFTSFRVRLFTQSQALLSLASLMFLAIAVASHVRAWWIRSLAVVTIVAFGLTLDVSQWHKMLLSESLSTSLMNLMIGLWLVVISLHRRWKTVLPVGRAILIGCLGCVTVLYSFARDANGYMVLSAALLMGLGLAVRKIRLHAARSAYLLMTGLMFAVPFLEILSVRGGERWVFPFANVLARRILPNEEAQSFFSEAGAPLEAAVGRTDLQQCVEDDCRSFRAFLKNEQQGGLLLEWIRKNGQRTYLRYLVSTADQALLAPLQNIRKMVGADSTEYRNRVHPDPNWFLVLRALLFPRSTILVVSLAVLSLGLMIFISLRSPARGHPLVPAFLVASLYPLMFVVWHGDAVEVERHAMQIAYQVRLAVWMAMVLGLDYLCARGAGPEA